MNEHYVRDITFHLNLALERAVAAEAECKLLQKELAAECEHTFQTAIRLAGLIPNDKMPAPVRRWFIDKCRTVPQEKATVAAAIEAALAHERKGDSERSHPRRGYRTATAAFP